MTKKESGYVAAKDLVINGKVIPKGSPIPPEVPKDRITNGLKIKSIVPAPAAKSTAPAAPAAAAPTEPTVPQALQPVKDLIEKSGEGK